MVKETFHYLLYPANKTTSQMKLTMAVYCFLHFHIIGVFLYFFEVVMGSVLGIVMNGTILSQIIVYQKPHGKKEKKLD